MKKFKYILLVIIAICLTACEGDESKRMQTMYAVQYTLELKDGPKTIIDIVYVDSHKEMGLVLRRDDTDKDVSNLVMVAIGGATGCTKKICSTRSRISSYGVINWKEVEPSNR